MVVDDLDALQEKFAVCDTIAFADLSTQMILVTNSATSLPREGLDNLCAEAALTMGTKRRQFLGTEPSSSAVVASRGQVRLFLRAKAEPNDILCCVSADELDINAFLAEAQPLLEKLSTGG
ncbi:hypothetical protein DS901_11130 [Loktanella sp. D2R18]|uniref:hypothetical protein n=1 Tax=Rhodobacterales TaxID=204455 RepID=UPI000DE89810|nr:MULTISPECIES: hypothetical protein [Rhodobacterales]MDO6590947.1 hypothetical protein [Yoonia sp. 1_MG-2023]RBW43359.1 hypothetical protein DS901_11130 [Loktanella sp. D2R18]